MRNNRTAQTVLCGLFTALIAIGAFIRIDFVVPITLQSTFVVLAGLVLGAKGGAVSTLVYILMGLAGLPVFAQGGGLMYALKPTFGYIMGFVLCAFVAGFVAYRRKAPTAGYLYFAGILGLAVVYIVGIVYFCLVMRLYINAPNTEILSEVKLTVLAVLPTDLLLLIPASIIAKRILPIIKKYGSL